MGKLEHLSASKFNSIEDCLGKYYFKYIKKVSVREITFIVTILGLTIHSIIEDIINTIKSGTKININKINSIIDSEFENRFNSIIEKETKENGKYLYIKKNFKETEAITSGRKWTKEFFFFLYNYILKYSKEFFSEKRFEIEFKEYLITGFIDFLSIDSKGNIYIIDFKTTSDIRKWFFVDFTTDIQSFFYSFAISKLYDKLPKMFAYTILSKDDKVIFVNSNKESRTFEQIETQFSQLIDKLNHYKSIAEDLNTWTPSEKKCSFCSYSGICSKAIKSNFNFREYLKIDL